MGGLLTGNRLFQRKSPFLISKPPVVYLTAVQSIKCPKLGEQCEFRQNFDWHWHRRLVPDRPDNPTKPHRQPKISEQNRAGFSLLWLIWTKITFSVIRILISRHMGGARKTRGPQKLRKKILYNPGGKKINCQPFHRVGKLRLWFQTRL